MFNPKLGMNLFLDDKVQRLTVSSHRKLMMKHQKHSDTKFADITELAMSDLEVESDTIFERFS